MKALINDKEVDILTIQPAGNGTARITFMETVEHEGQKTEREVVAFITKDDLIIEPNKETQ